MHGLFNRGLQCFVRDIYGPDVWEETCTEAELPFYNFESMLRYEDGVTNRVIAALSRVLKRPRNELLEDFGTYVVSEAHLASIRRLLRFGGETYEEFLHSLEDVHDRAKMAIPDLEVPRLRLTPLSNKRYELHYHFAKTGFGGVLLGMLRGMADDYGALVVVEHSPLQEHGIDKDIFLISLARVGGGETAKKGGFHKKSHAMPVLFQQASLDVLMPLHLQLGHLGIIQHIGPSFARLLGGAEITGQNLFDVMEFRRPNGLNTWQGLLSVANQGLIVRLHELPDHNLRAVCVPHADGGGMLIDFSLGAGVFDIVRERKLNSQDFSPADLTAEMLYLKEVQYMALGDAINSNTRLEGAKNTAEKQAFSDALTGLPNRRALYGFMARLLAREKGGEFAVMLIDLDFFKAVNDTHGHGAGDHVLQHVAAVLRSVIRPADMVARIGGDEFVLVLGDLALAADLQEIAGRIIAEIAKPIQFDAINCQIGASIGAVVVKNGDKRSCDVILTQADAALYKSKKSGRGQFTLESIFITKNQEVA